MIKRQKMTIAMTAFITIMMLTPAVEASAASCSMLQRQWSARHAGVVTEKNTYWNRYSTTTANNNNNSRRMYHSSSSSSSRRRNDKSILLAWGKKTPTETTTTTTKPVTEMQQGESQPSLQEMRAQLGPVGRTIASGVEIGVITGGSYISGGLLGYFLGGLLGTPTLFLRSSSASAAANLKSAHTLGDEIKSRVGNWHGKAAKQAKSWAGLSAAFSGFHALTRTLRGGKEDKWNNILGSAATGAYLSRQNGPQAMIQGAATYAGFTYVLDQFLGGSYNRDPNNNAGSDEFDFKDAPVEERGF